MRCANLLSACCLLIAASHAEAIEPAAVLVSHAEDGGKPLWRYTTNIPPADWASPKFDDSKWQEGPAGFGKGVKTSTEWRTGQIWLRREFTIERGQKIGAPVLRIFHDEVAIVFLNGVAVARYKGFQTSYVDRPLNPQVLTLLKPGKNCIAVTCIQRTGGQYIDVGLVDRSPPGK
jgi:hypothetical protein